MSLSGDGPGARRPRTGVVLPTFAERPDRALALAAEAARAGVDGVFCYDHLWPMGRPDRPALAPFPVLAAVAATIPRVMVGTLVARVGLVPDHVLLAQFDALATLAPGRVVAGLGTGDRQSAGENEAYGMAFTDAGTRRRSLRTCVRAARTRGFEVWVGGGSARTRAIAADEVVALNLWDASVDAVAEAARASTVTWAGPAPATAELASLVDRLGRAGAQWVVVAGPVDLDELAAAGAAGTPAPVAPPTFAPPPAPTPPPRVAAPGRPPEGHDGGR